MTRVRRGRRASNHWQQFVTQVSSSGNVLYICNICRNTFNSKHVYSHVRQAHRREFQAASGTLHAAADDKSSSEDDTRSSHEENPCSMDVDEGQPRQQTAETPDSTAAAGAAGADAVVSDSEGLFDQEDEVPEGADDSQQHDSELDDEFTEQAAEQDQDYTAFWDRYYDGDWCSSDEGSDSAHDTGSDDSEAGTSSGSAGEAGTQSDGDDEETDSSEHGGCSSSDNSRDRSGTDGSSRSGSQTESSARSGTSSATSSGSDPSSGVSDSGSASSAGSDSDDSPAPNTIPWYQQRLEMPVWPGASITLRQMLYDDFRNKRAFNLSDKAFDANCRLKATGGHLPAGNIYPPSGYLARGAIGAGSWQDYQVHVCAHPECVGFTYEYVSPKQYANHAAAKCPHCGEPRFKRVKHGRKWVLQPRWWYIYFDLAKVIARYYQDPDWVEAYDDGIPPSTQHLITRSDATADSGSASSSSSSTPVADDDDGSLWYGTEVRRLLEKHGIDLTDRNCGAWELCLDWVRVFKTVSYSVGVLGIRCAKRNNMVRSKAVNHKILAILPGPTIPSNMRPYLLRTMLDFERLGLGALQGNTPGLKVTQYSVDQHGNRFQECVMHKPYLIGVHADSPARQKAAAWLAVSAYLACGWCIFKAAMLLSATGRQHVYPTGYSVGVPQPARCGAAEGTPMLVGDRRLQLTDNQQMARAVRVQRTASGAARKSAAKDEGCSGLSVIPQYLPYVSYNNIWVAPVIHMLLYGVVVDFLRHIFQLKGSKTQTAASRAELVGDSAAAASVTVGVLSSEQKRIISSRAAHLQLTSDFGRGYRDVVEHLNSFKMEELLHFVESIAPIVFYEATGQQVMPSITRQLWEHLRAAVLHYCRPPTAETPFTAESRQRAMHHIREYARLLQVHQFPDCMFTWNLHWAVCRLLAQEIARGSTGADAEWWTERIMQMFKELLGDRVSHKAEQVCANTALVDYAISSMQLTDPTLKARDQLLCSASSSMLAHNEDPGDSDGCQLLGKGRRPTRVEKQLLLDAARRFVNRHAELAPAWTEQSVAESFQLNREEGRGVLVFQRADKAGDEMISTDSYGRSVSRHNHYVQVSWQGGRGHLGDRRRPFVARVRYLMWLRHPSNAPWDGMRIGQSLSLQRQAQLNRDLRLALVDQFAEPTQVGGVIRVANRQSIAASDNLRPVSLSQIDAKLVVFENPESSEMLCTRYSNLSKLR